jgi:L-fuconolactonase
VRIDAHQHFWRLARGDYDWLDVSDPALAPLARDFEPADMTPLREANAVTQIVLVQAAATEAETEHLLALADEHEEIAGVVGWIDLADTSRLPTLQRWARHPKFKGVRPMLQDLPDVNWLDHGPAPAMVQALVDLGLRFDALVKTEHLPALARFAARWPTLPIVIDHAAKPALAQGWRAPWAQAWRAGMGELARQPGVCCKFSGLMTEMGDHAEPAELLAPVWQTLVAIFGADRLMWGSDWPVLTLAVDFGSWVELAGDCIATLPAADQATVWRGTAARFYGLPA